MAVKAPPVVAPVPVFSWTGFYIGLHGGGAWFDKDWNAPASALNLANGGCGAPCPVFAGSHTGSSWLAGAQAGVNYQTGIWVLGVEVDGSWTDLKGSNVSGLAAFLTNNSKTEVARSQAGSVSLPGRPCSTQRAVQRLPMTASSPARPSRAWRFNRPTRPAGAGWSALVSSTLSPTTGR